MATVKQDCANLFRHPLLPEAELLTADFFQHRFTPHWHDGFAIAMVEAGAERYQYRGSQLVATPDTVATVNPDEIHTGEPAGEEGWRYRVFYVPEDWMKAQATGLSGNEAGTPWMPDQVIADPDAAHRLSQAHRLLESGADPLLAETVLTDAFATLLLRHARTRPVLSAATPDAVRVALMREALADDLMGTLSLSDLAASVGLSPFHAARLFSRTVGMAPHAWRNQLRLSRAASMLRHGVSATEVAAATGFTDQSHFTRHFKRAYGMAPGRWAKG